MIQHECSLEIICLIAEVGDKNDKALEEFEHDYNDGDEVAIRNKVFKQPSPVNVEHEQHYYKSSRSITLSSSLGKDVQKEKEFEDFNLPMNLQEHGEESERSPSPVIFYGGSVSISLLVRFLSFFNYLLSNNLGTLECRHGLRDIHVVLIFEHSIQCTIS